MKVKGRIVRVRLADETRWLTIMDIWILLAAAGAVAIGIAGMAHGQDVGAGAAVFKTQCSVCHSPLEGKNLVGPSLFGIVGRQAGQIPGFHYSPANRDSGLTWDAATLDRYLTSPKDVVPKTIMPYVGLKDDQNRADLIAYLTSLH
jgi:cytochrome c2